MALEKKVFGKYSLDVEVADSGLKKYICLEPRIVLANQGKHASRPMGKKNVCIVERLANNMMRSGTGGKVGGKLIRGRHGCGKKEKTLHIVEASFAIIERNTKTNPIEVLIKAIENGAPREETTRVRFGGVVYPIAVDVSPQRRVDVALRNIGMAVMKSSFDTKKSAAQALADEIILAAKSDPQSNIIKRRTEVERMASGSR